jgi:hypothetical protein
MEGETDITEQKIVVEGEPKDKSVAPPKETTKVEPAKAKTTPAKEEAEKIVPDDADDESLADFADKDGYIRIPFRQFRTRIARASKADLKKLFGTDDRAALLKQKEEYERLVNDNEKRRKEQLSELEREREDRKKAEEKAAELQRKIDEQETNAAFDQAQQTVEKSASVYFADDYVDYAISKLKSHIRKLTEDEADAEFPEGKKGDEALAAWFEKLATKHKAMARPKPKDDDKSKKPETKTVKKGITNSPTDDERPDHKKDAGEKSIKEMTRAEIKAKYNVSY